jgi:hypothetical protein
MQTKMDIFLDKKKGRNGEKKKEDRHDSSRENS